MDKAPAEVVQGPSRLSEGGIRMRTTRVETVDRRKLKEKNIFLFCLGFSVPQESVEKVEKKSILMKTRLSLRMVCSTGYSEGVSKTLTFTCPLHLGGMLQCVLGSHKLLLNVSLFWCLLPRTCHPKYFNDIWEKNAAERWRMMSLL